MIYSFVHKMVFYIKRLRGSDAYWRQKRAELYNFVHYHIAEGHGPPNGFFTLSCAECFWPDMIRLLEDRIWIAGGRHRNGPGAKIDKLGNLIDLVNDRKARNKAVNDYAVVIQEFFIRRTEDYLNTVGRDVLGIEYYWLRFEFAKGRGQIHAHIMVTLKKEIQNEIQHQVNSACGNREREANVISDWADRQFGMTAKLNEPMEDESQRSTKLASTIRLAEVDDYRLDEAMLCKETMMHECSSYCMRNKKGKKNAQRFCRAGAGDEATKNKSDTPGFPLTDSPKISLDQRGFFKLEMPRNHLRLVQAALHV